MRTRVVLPAPLGPSRPSTLARSAARSTPQSALVVPNAFLTPATSIMVSAISPLETIWCETANLATGRPPSIGWLTARWPSAMSWRRSRPHRRVEE